MDIGAGGLKILNYYEQGPGGGVALEAYPDTGGVWTIGWGHTRGVRKGDKCTPQQADAWLLEDVRVAVSAVNSLVAVPLTQNQFDALVCLVFNIGVQAFANSTIRRLLNAKNYQAAAAQFARWRFDNGRELNGLIARRESERKLFVS